MAIVLSAGLGHFNAWVLKTYSTLVNQTGIVLHRLLLWSQGVYSLTGW